SAAFAFAIASFMEASTASGVCSQSGIVSTAFAFAAAARKSSTVFRSAVSRVEEVAAMNRRQRRDDFIRLGMAESATDIHRFSEMAERILMNLWLICVHLWRPAFGKPRATMIQKFFLA